MPSDQSRDRPSPTPPGEALPEETEVAATRDKLARLLALGAVRAAMRVNPQSAPTPARKE